jgi:outer membrane protein assembly factor BamB
MASLPRGPVQVGVALGLILAVTSTTLFVLFGAGPSSDTASTSNPLANGTVTTTTTVGTTSPLDSTTTTEAVGPEPFHLWVDRRTVGQPMGTAVEGLITFRGNLTGTYYGQGPVPATPEIAWRFPDAPLCGESTDLGVTATWCGNGWTGQPVVWERPDGVTEIMVGAYDHRFHFIDAATGTRSRSPILTGDIVKGSPSLDPDGFPLVFFGSRDNHLRIVALDREDPVELWSFETPKPLCTVDTRDEHGTSCFGLWNDDWDAAPRILNDYLFASGENSVFYIWKLNRTYDAVGLVQVDPQLVTAVPSWNDQLIADIQNGCSIPARCPSTSNESTPVFFEGRVYFSNSGGRVMGLDITDLESGEAPIVFDYWVGDDVDGSIVIDDEGMLYVPVEWKRFLQRGEDLGQLIKLDPYTSGDPYVWGMYSLTTPPAQGGMFSTPALGDGVLYVVTHRGFLVVVDQETGEELWAYALAPGSWSSPVVVDDQLVTIGYDSVMRVWSLTDPQEPRLIWTFPVGDATIEATPAVWKGGIYVFSRDGYLYAIKNKPA